MPTRSRSQVSCAHVWPLQKRERKLKTLRDTDWCAAIKGGFSTAPALDREAWHEVRFLKAQNNSKTSQSISIASSALRPPDQLFSSRFRSWAGKDLAALLMPSRSFPLPHIERAFLAWYGLVRCYKMISPLIPSGGLDACRVAGEGWCGCLDECARLR